MTHPVLKLSLSGTAHNDLQAAEERARKGSTTVKVDRDALRHLLMDFTGALGLLTDLGQKHRVIHPQD